MCASVCIYLCIYIYIIKIIKNDETEFEKSWTDRREKKKLWR